MVPTNLFRNLLSLRVGLDCLQIAPAPHFPQAVLKTSTIFRRRPGVGKPPPVKAQRL